MYLPGIFCSRCTSVRNQELSQPAAVALGNAQPSGPESLQLFPRLTHSELNQHIPHV